MNGIRKVLKCSDRFPVNRCGFMRSHIKILRAVAIAAVCLTSTLTRAAEPSRDVIAFYYGWYGNPATDGEWRNWNHAVADDSGKRFPGGDDIGANFYPEAGAYSSAEVETLDRQMLELRRARVGVISASWWGKDHLTDRNMKRLLDAAHTHGIFVNFHIEPFGGRNGKRRRRRCVISLIRMGSIRHCIGWRRTGGRIGRCFSCMIRT